MCVSMTKTVRWLVGRWGEWYNGYRLSWVQGGIHVGAALLHLVFGSAV